MGLAPAGAATAGSAQLPSTRTAWHAGTAPAVFDTRRHGTRGQKRLECTCCSVQQHRRPAARSHRLHRAPAGERARQRRRHRAVGGGAPHAAGAQRRPVRRRGGRRGQQRGGRRSGRRRCRRQRADRGWAGQHTGARNRVVHGLHKALAAGAAVDGGAQGGRPGVCPRGAHAHRVGLWQVGRGARGAGGLGTKRGRADERGRRRGRRWGGSRAGRCGLGRGG